MTDKTRLSAALAGWQVTIGPSFSAATGVLVLNWFAEFRARGERGR